MYLPPHALAEVNPQKLRTGLSRVWHATGYFLEDMGSAAVLPSLLLAAGIWIAALAHRFG